MKTFVAILSLFALMNLTVAKYATAGEVAKKPLNLQEMVELNNEQAQDFEAVKDTEAGIANGYGLFTLALAIGVGYLVYDEIQNEDEDN